MDKDEPKRGLDKDNLVEGSIEEEPMLKDWLELKEKMWDREEESV